MFNYIKKIEIGKFADGTPDIETKVNIVKIIEDSLIFLFIVLPLLFGTWVIISPTERGVVIRLGNINRVISSGIHLKFPYVEEVEKIDITTQKHEVNVSAASKDLQTVNSTIALNFHRNSGNVAELWSKFKGDEQSRIIDPFIQESVKSATAKLTAEELITKREVVKENIRVELKSRLSENYLIVDDLNIVNFEFSKSFDEAIESKVTAEQEALRAKNQLEKVKFEAEQRIAQATAEAEAIRIQAQAITQQGGEDYVNLKAVEKWNGVLPTQMIPNATLPFINLTK